MDKNESICIFTPDDEITITIPKIIEGIDTKGEVTIKNIREEKFLMIRDGNEWNSISPNKTFTKKIDNAPAIKFKETLHELIEDLLGGRLT